MGQCDGCGDVTIPTVNNDSKECCELTPANCVVTSEYQNFFKIGKGKTLTFVIDVIAKFVKALTLRVEALEAIHNYKTFTAVVNQSGATPSDIPTAIVVNNGLTGAPTPVWARTSAGQYTLTMTGAFTANKTIIELKEFNIAWGEKVKAYWVDVNTIAIASGSTTDYIDDDVITDMPIEIKVYD